MIYVYWLLKRMLFIYNRDKNGCSFFVFNVNLCYTNIYKFLIYACVWLFRERGIETHMKECYSVISVLRKLICKNMNIPDVLITISHIGKKNSTDLIYRCLMTISKFLYVSFEWHFKHNITYYCLWNIKLSLKIINFLNNKTILIFYIFIRSIWLLLWFFKYQLKIKKSFVKIRNRYYFVIIQNGETKRKEKHSYYLKIKFLDLKSFSRIN